MPFSAEWFYGDTLFIVDPWVWLALGLGLYCSLRRERTKRTDAAKPVWLALGLVTLYVQAMALSGREARAIAISEATGSGAAVNDAMAGPVPLDPFVRTFVIEQEGHYEVGTFRWLEEPHVDASKVRTFPRARPSHPAFDLAAESAVARRFLGWARYPTFEIQQMANDRFLVHLIDLRYAQEPGGEFGTVTIPVTLPKAALPALDAPAPP
jgi:inner membrane protein